MDSGINILLVDDDDNLRFLEKLGLDNLDVSTSIEEANSAKSAIEKVESHPDGFFDIIISDYEMDDGDGGVLYHYVRERDESIPFIMCSSKIDFKNTNMEHFPFYSDREIFIQKPFSYDDLGKHVLQFCHQQPQRHAEYAKIRVPFFWRYNKTLCDIYVKISEKKYVKIIKKNTVYNKQDIDKYVKKKVEFLYIRHEEYEKHSHDFNFDFLTRDKMSIGGPEEEIELAQAIIHDLVSSVGVSAEVIKLTEDVFCKVKDQFDDRDLITKLIMSGHERNKYFYDHSYLLACFCIAIATPINWESNDEDILKKLVTAAIIHDLNTDDDSETINLDLGLLDIDSLDKERKEAYIHHPYRMAVLYSKSKFALNDVETIIMQHHEMPDGSGYPRQLTSNNITPLSSIFIIAHYFVNQLYLNNFDRDHVRDIVIHMSKIFNVGSFKLYFHEFVKTFDEFYVN